MNSTFAYRPLCAWGDGDLPAPYAVGDIIDVPAGAKALERMVHAPGAGRYEVSSVWSIDEGDAWYVRLCYKAFPASRRRRVVLYSDRLHVATAARCESFDEDTDWLAGCTLVVTADPAGLAQRNDMLAGGWRLAISPAAASGRATKAVVDAARAVLSRSPHYDTRAQRDLRKALAELDRLRGQ